MSQLILAFDVVNQAYVGGYNGSAAVLPAFRQGQYQTKIYLVQPVSNALPGSNSYEAFDATGYDGLRVGIWSASTGTLGDEDANVLALTDQLGWAYVTSDPDNPYFAGTFNTLTQQVADWIGTATSKAAFFAANLTNGTALSPVLDQKGGVNVTLYAGTDGGGGVPIDMTQLVPLVGLPLQFKNPATGHIFAIVESASSPPTLEFVCLNP